jgi:chaperonin GroES
MKGRRMKLKPLGNRVVIKALEAEQTTASGIVIPDSAKEKPAQGEIVAIGSGKVKNGIKIPMEVKVGDRVLYSKYGPQEVKIDNEKYLILSEDDILAVLEK